MHADIPAADSTQLQELEGMTQLPQHKLELLGKHCRPLQCGPDSLPMLQGTNSVFVFSQ